MTVYFAQEKEGGPIKIGFSFNVKLRTKHWRVIALLPGARKTEKYLHGKFAHLRIAGEWFRPETELLEFIVKPELPDFDEEEKEPKSETLQVRLMEDELQSLSQLARTYSLPTSAWARMILLRECKGTNS